MSDCTHKEWAIEIDYTTMNLDAAECLNCGAKGHVVEEAELAALREVKRWHDMEICGRGEFISLEQCIKVAEQQQFRDITDEYCPKYDVSKAKKELAALREAAEEKQKLVDVVDVGRQVIQEQKGYIVDLKKQICGHSEHIDALKAERDAARQRVAELELEAVRLGVLEKAFNALCVDIQKEINKWNDKQRSELEPWQVWLKWCSCHADQLILSEAKEVGLIQPADSKIRGSAGMADKGPFGCRHDSLQPYEQHETRNISYICDGCTKILAMIDQDELAALRERVAELEAKAELADQVVEIYNDVKGRSIADLSKAYESLGFQLAAAVIRWIDCQQPAK